MFATNLTCWYYLII